MLLMNMYGERPKPISEAVHSAITSDKQNSRIDAYPGSEPDTPGWFDGTMEAIYGAPASAWYETKAAVQGTVADWDFVDEDYRKELDDWAQDNIQRAKSFEPDPLTTGTAAQIIYGVGRDLSKLAMAVPVGAGVSFATGNPIAGTLATASLFGANLSESESQKLQSQGVDEETADRAGRVQGVMGAVGVLIPGGIGARRAVNAAYGAGVNLLTNANEMAAVNMILKEANYDDVAEQYDWSDPTNAAVSAIFGGVTGAVTGRSSRQVRPIEADAARVRATEIENTANLPVDVNNGQQVSAGYKTQQAVKAAIDNKQKPVVSVDSVSQDRVSELKAASEKKMAAAMKESGNVLQNRDRSSKASVTQMKSIAANPDYGRLGFSRSFTEGAPVIAYAGDVPEVQIGREDFIVDADGKRYRVRYAVVEADTVSTSNRIDGSENPLYGSDEVPTAVAGNARTTGLQEAYRQGTADNYRAEMSQDPMSGIDPSVYEGMDKPILVRIMDDKDVTPNIGDVTNRSSTQQLSLVEQAQTDSQRVDLAALRYDEDGDITADSVVEFLSLLPAEERANLIDANGIPTKPAFDRLNRAIFQAAYGDANATALLDTTEKTGVSRLLGAFRQLAPRVLGLEGEMDFRQAMLEVLSEIREAKRSGKKVSIADIAAQRSFTRSPEADAFLQFFAKNEREGGGVSSLVQTFSDLADFARANTDNAAQGVDLFGEVAQPTRLDLMRRFSDLTGVEIDEAKFRPVADLKDAVKFEKASVREAKLKKVEKAKETLKSILGEIKTRLTNRKKGEVIADGPATPFMQVSTDLKVLAKENGYDIDSYDSHSFDLSAYRHIQKRHGQGNEQRSDQRPVLDSDIERIPEVIENYDSVNFGAKTDRGNDAIVYQKTFSDGTFIAVEEVRKKNRKLGVHTLYIKKPGEVRGEVIPLDPTSETAPGFSSEVLQQPSTNSIGQNVSNVNSLRAEQRLLEKTEDIAEANIVRESLNQLPQDAQSSIQKEALQAINETPTMRIQLDEGETSITAAEYLARQEAEAERIRQEAQQGVPEAVACVFLNNGMDQ
jgi:hypothetical protein